MLTFTHKTDTFKAPDATLTLPWEKRIKSRLRVTLDNGIDAGLFLPRGQVLRGGDVLATEAGDTVRVVAADETLSTAHADSPRQLNLACYHLGNRHVDVEIGTSWVRYKHDHVLDEMIQGLGLHITCDQRPFEPEAGAYGQAHHHGSHH